VTDGIHPARPFIFGVAPGQIERLPLLIGTASCTPRLGYAIRPGDWGIQATLTPGPAPLRLARKLQMQPSFGEAEPQNVQRGDEVKSNGIDKVRRWSSEELLLRVAWFYYKDELTQDEIAERLSVSRGSVRRLLDRARKVGLVTTKLNAEYLDAVELSVELRRVFDLSETFVVLDLERERADHRLLNARIGKGGTQFISTHLRPGATLGVAWDGTVSRVMAATNFGSLGPVHGYPHRWSRRLPADDSVVQIRNQHGRGHDHCEHDPCLQFSFVAIASSDTPRRAVAALVDAGRMLLLAASAGRWGLWLSRRTGSPACSGSCAGSPG
jgi:predicted DNA-binding protein (UPF0251 family)